MVVVIVSPKENLYPVEHSTLEERIKDERLCHKLLHQVGKHITWEAVDTTQCCSGWQLCSPGTGIMLGKCFSLILNLPVENSRLR